MKDSIYGLSLGTLVRQMMCGIVFFIPIVLWKQNGNWDSIVSWLQKWETAGLIAFGAAAACIGTLIYHLEKNLWAYFWQYIRIEGKEYAWEWMWGLMFIGGIGILVCALYYLCPHLSIVIGGIYFLIMMLAICIPLLRVVHKVSNLVEHTQNMWRTASRLPDDFVAFLEKSNADTKTVLELYEVKEIARREAGWADYIHCGQTAAFSWILSCLLIWGNICSCSGTSPNWFIPSLFGAVWLLGFEMLCEIHKQLHIDRLLAEYDKLKKEIGTK